MSISATFAIPSRAGAIDDARRWVTGHLQPAGASCRCDLGDRAGTDGGPGERDRARVRETTLAQVELALEVDDDRVTIEIVDSGAHFDAASYAPPDLGAPSDGGYGVHLIDELMDEVDRQPAGDHGTRLRLVKQGWRNRQ